MKQVLKRDGAIVDFQEIRILNAVIRAVKHSPESVSDDFVVDVVKKVVNKVNRYKEPIIDLEIIQDYIEIALMNTCRKDIAQEFTRYRHARAVERNKRTNIDVKARGLLDMTDSEIINENSNKDSHVIPTQRDLLAGIMAKDFAQKYMIPQRVVDAHESGDIHFHDQDYSPFFPMFNCMLINLGDMLENGFKLGNAEIETPKSIATACAVTAQIIAQVASHIYGGNTINEIDKILAPYVKKSFDKHFATGLEWMGNISPDQVAFYASLNDSDRQEYFPTSWKYAVKMTEKETYDAFQALEYEINTLATSNGQTPFTTFGFGRGTSWEERQIQIAILKNRIRGIGKEGKTPVFPKLIFALEEGVNLYPTDPNYDIKQLAIKSTTLRMYPDMVSVPKIKEITGSFKFPMGCRSFLGKYEENGQEIHDGRFNMGVVTINLPRIAIESENWMDFFERLDKRLDVCKEALLYRIDRLKGVRAKVAPILYMEGAVSRLQPEDTIDMLLENGRASISLGYIGVHEAILALSKGDHIYDSTDDRFNGEFIVEYMSKKTDQWKTETGYGFGLYSTPAESLCYRFCKLDAEKFGDDLLGITDKGYYTNSFHLDVAKKVTPFEKILFEKEYPKYANGGFITYCEFDSLVNNPSALEAVWDFAYQNVPYFGTNTPVDKCLECNFEGEFEATASGFECPNCGNRNPKTISVIRRCCGYLSEPSQRPFNKGKQQEVLARIKHN